MSENKLNKIVQGDNGYQAATKIYDNDVSLAKAVNDVKETLEANKKIIDETTGEVQPFGLLSTTGTSVCSGITQEGATQVIDEAKAKINAASYVGERIKTLGGDETYIESVDISEYADTDTSGRSIVESFDEILAYTSEKYPVLDSMNNRVTALEEKLKEKEAEKIANMDTSSGGIYTGPTIVPKPRVVVSALETYLSQTQVLYTLAQEAINETASDTGTPKITNPDQLVAMYGRSKAYNNSTWDLEVGPLSGPQYTAFKAKADEKYPKYLSVDRLTLNEGYVMDVPHFWATINGQTVGLPNVIGWGGDLAQFAGDYYANTSITFPSNRFGIEDLVADLDAYNIGNFGTAKTGYVAAMKAYFASITHKARCQKFCADGKTVWQKYEAASDNNDINILAWKYVGSFWSYRSTYRTVSNMMQSYLNKWKS